MIFWNLNFYSLLLFFLLIFLVLFLFSFFLLKKRRLSKIFKLRYKKKYFFIKYIFLIFSFLILLFFIFEPKSYKVDDQKKYWIPIVFALDVSKSMNVLDVWENITRLELAKKSIENFIINNPNNNYSLVIFAWEAVWVLPLTNDINVFLTMLENVDYKNLNNQWTDFSSAIYEANNRLEITENNSWAVILLSDWWDEQSKDLEKLYNENYNYFFAWVWSKKGWEIIIWKDAFWRYNYQTFAWEIVISKLNENNLKNLSRIFDWEYQRIQNTSDINSFENNLKNIQEKILESGEKTLYNYSRDITIISFIFFILYLFLYFFEHKIYFLNKKND